MTLNTFSTNVQPNIVDYAMMTGPDGKINTIAWLLAQANPVLKDMTFQQANGPTYHEVTLNTALPQGTWRANNQGVPASKGMNARVKFGIGMITDYSQLDRAQARL